MRIAGSGSQWSRSGALSPPQRLFSARLRDHPSVIRHALAPVLPAAALGLGLPRTLGPGADGVALTFDDGPHPKEPRPYSRSLARASARATFFVIGEQVRAPAPPRRRGFSPRATRWLSTATATASSCGSTPATSPLIMARGLIVVGDAAGESPRLHRPPYGVYSPAGLRFVRAAVCDRYSGLAGARTGGSSRRPNASRAAPSTARSPET